MKLFTLLLATFLAVSTYANEPVTTVTVNLSVTEKGFEPNKFDVETNKPIKLNITRRTDSTCSTSIQIPSLKVKKDLPLNKTVSVELGKLAKGEIRFGCGMSMMDSGIIYVK